MNQFFYKKIEENFEEVKKNCFEHFYNIDEVRPHTRDFSHELGRLYIC